MAAQEGTIQEVLVLAAGAAVAFGLALATSRKTRPAVEEDTKEIGKVLGRGFVDEAAFGIVDPLADRFLLTPEEVRQWEAMKKRHRYANVAGRGGGFAASMLYGGEIVKGASALGKGAMAARAGLVAGRAAEEAVVRGGEKAAILAAEKTAERAAQEAAKKAAVEKGKKTLSKRLFSGILGRAAGDTAEAAILTGVEKVPMTTSEIAKAKLREGAGQLADTFGEKFHESVFGEAYQLALERAKERSSLLEESKRRARQLHAEPDEDV